MRDQAQDSSRARTAAMRLTSAASSITPLTMRECARETSWLSGKGSSAYWCPERRSSSSRRVRGGRTVTFVVTPGLGRATPIMQSRVTIAANCSSLQSSVPAGRTGSTRNRCFELESSTRISISGVRKRPNSASTCLGVRTIRRR